jgi:hypothetical protein
MADPTRDRLLAVFRDHRVKNEIREVVPRAADEAVFVVAEEDAGAVRNRDLIVALQQLLQRKVWVVRDLSIWHRQSEPI